MVAVSGTVLIPSTCGDQRIATLTSCAKGFEEAIASKGSKAILQRHEKEETQTFTKDNSSHSQSASRQVTIRSGSHLSTKEAQRVDDLPKVTQLWVDCHACLTPKAVFFPPCAGLRSCAGKRFIHVLGRCCSHIKA